MTKRLTIAMVAVVLFVLMAIMPVSALNNGTQIDKGATIFIGEQHLNLTHAFTQGLQPGTGYDAAPANLSIGWWASAAVITTTPPTKPFSVATSYRDFTVEPAAFVGYTGNWYQLVADGSRAFTGADGNPVVVFNVADPTLSVAVWDFQQSSDVTGKSVPQGEHLGFQINTNMNAATLPNRNNTVYANTYAGIGATTPAYFDATPDGVAGVAGRYACTNSTGIIGTNNTYWANTTVVPVGLVRNYTTVRLLTTYGTTFGQYYEKYWNNTAPALGTGQDLINPWTAKNYTSDAAGLVPITAFGAASGTAFATASVIPNAATDGFITIKVKDANGATYSALRTTDGADTSLLKQFPTLAPAYFGTSTNYWVTDAVDFSNQYLYPVGTYTAWLESTLNGMKDNYKNAGADYTGKTVSGVGSITLVSDSVKIEANKDSVVRSKSFSVTVTGKPSTTYYVWVKGTSSMTGAYDNQPPMVNINQEKVYMDNANAAGIAPITHRIGDYQYENGAGSTIWSDVAQTTDAVLDRTTFNRTRYYALINTSTSGTRTVEFTTNNGTKAQKYTIRVEQHMPQSQAVNSGYGTVDYLGTGAFKSDEVDVKVEKGAVTIVAAGDQSYYLGEEIKFSGTNTESYKTYLFIMGPNLKPLGSQIQKDNPRMFEVVDGLTTSFKEVDVNGDNTWSWKWGTSKVALDAGTYTIYAVSQPRAYGSSTLANAAFGTVSIIIKKPFVSATASQSTVAQGDKIFITGTAEGNPVGVKIWILGKNYPTDATQVKTESVNSDASFKYEVTQSATKTLYPGQYFVVVQHPMQNNIFDIDTAAGTLATNDAGKTNVVNKQLVAGQLGTKIFTLLGAGSLQGSDAAEALVQGINSPNVDDTYTKLQFLVEVPVIRIDPIGDKHVGDKFTITAATNLAVDDEVLVQVYSSSFKPTQKSQSGEFSGATGTVKVAKGDSGMNKISFDVDSSTFKPDEYIVTEEAILQVATGTALFNVLEGAAPVVTTKAPVVVTTVATAIPTTVATAVPTPIPTTKSPGYGALIALIGLGAVAFIVVRRH